MIKKNPLQTNYAKIIRSTHFLEILPFELSVYSYLKTNKVFFREGVLNRGLTSLNFFSIAIFAWKM